MVPPLDNAGEGVNSFTGTAAAARPPASTPGPGARPFALYNRRVQTTL
jgi:hypothetical protein